MIDSLPDDDSVKFFIDMIRRFNAVTGRKEEIFKAQNPVSEKRQAFLHMEELKKYPFPKDYGYMCTKKELKFCIFIIYHLSEKWKKSPSEVYKILNSTGILDDYIIKCYDTLHTLGTNYLVEDITDFVKEKGALI